MTAPADQPAPAEQPASAELYPFDERPEMLALVPPSAKTILDVGCGRGGFGFALRRQEPARSIWAVEADTKLAAEAAVHYDNVLEGIFPGALEEQGNGHSGGPHPPPPFDCIAFNDVLEHMIDPWSALRAATRYLAPSGVVVASIPNVRNAETVAGLVVRGDWTYVDMGVLDRTHLRFFTRRTILALFEESGYQVEAVRGISGIGRSRSPLARHLPKVLGDFAYRGFGVRARAR